MNSKKIISSIVMACVIASTAYVPTISEFTNTAVVSAAYNTYSNSSAKFTYSIFNNSAIITKVTPASGATTITVPGTIAGYTVTIGTNSFSNISNSVSAIRIPYAIEKIQKSAFANCTGIETVDIRKGCKSIDSNAFTDCYNLKTVKITSDEKMEICENAFHNCTALSSITINNQNDFIIRKNAFDRCTSLLSLELSGDHSALYVNEGAFNNSGLIKHANVIKNERSMAAYRDVFGEKDYTNKNCNTLLGKCLNLVIYVDHSRNQFSNNDINSISTKIKSNYDYLKKEAQKYNKTFDMSVISYTYTANNNDYIPDPNCGDEKARTYSQYVAKALSSVNSTCEKFVKENPNASTQDVLNYVKKQEGYKNVFVTVVYKTNDTDFSMNKFGDICVLFAKNSNNKEIAHETCHIAQAVDYYTDRCDGTYVNRYLSNDIMKRVDGSPHVGWATAASLGWTDTIYAKDHGAIYWWGGNR